MKINNKVAVVTGGASGLGEASTRHYVTLGAKVVIFDMNNECGQLIADELGDVVRVVAYEMSKNKPQTDCGCRGLIKHPHQCSVRRADWASRLFGIQRWYYWHDPDYGKRFSAQRYSG